MTTDERPDDVGPGDATVVARRAFARASSSLEVLRRQITAILKDVEWARRSLQKAGVAPDIERRLYKTEMRLQEMSERRVRVDGEPQPSRGVGMLHHRFFRMWRPPVPPPSPEELGAVAVVCGCLEHLTSSAQVRLHWETGCFDVPEYVFEWDEDAELLFGEPDADSV